MVDQPQPHQRPRDRRPARHRVEPLPTQPIRQPVRPPPRMQRSKLGDPYFYRRIHLMRARPRPMRTITQTLQPLSRIPRQPRMQRLPAHPHLAGHLRDRQTILDHRQNRLIPLLSHAQLPKHHRAPSASTYDETTTATNRCQESTETVSTISRDTVKPQASRKRHHSTETTQKPRCPVDLRVMGDSSRSVDWFHSLVVSRGRRGSTPASFGLVQECSVSLFAAGCRRRRTAGPGR